MRNPLRAVHRLTVVGLGLAVLALSPAWASAAAPSEKSLPSTTFAFLKVKDASQLREVLESSQLGQLLADPALKPLKEDIKTRLEEPNKQLKSKLGVSISELMELPQGTAWMALIPRDDPKLPFTLLLTADAGENEQKMNDVMTKATKLAEQDGGKVSTEMFQDLTITVIQPPEKEEGPTAPVVWTKSGSLFYVSSDLAALKDLVSHADGLDKSLADKDSYKAIQEKVAGAEAPVIWYLDLEQILKLVSQAAAAQGGNAAQVDAQLQITGITGLKGLGGSIAFHQGQFDQVLKTYLYAPGQSQGLIKIFAMPTTNLRPEPWVPAGVASYQTISWDLDRAYTAINELADMVLPGVLANIEAQISGPNGEKISFQKDLFGPLGDRITIVSDFKKPVTEESQRTLFAVALEDPKAFQNTLNKLVSIAQAAPKKREFQGTTIYDFDVQLPNAEQVGLKGPISLAIAKDTLFVSTDPTLLEQVLRPGGPSLADTPEFQSVAKVYPTTVSSLSFQRPEEQARIVYDMVKSGQLKQAADAAAQNAGGDVQVGQLIDPEKLPDFSVFAKYLSQGGGYSVMEQDGVTFTQFTLRKANP